MTATVATPAIVSPTVERSRRRRLPAADVATFAVFSLAAALVAVALLAPVLAPFDPDGQRLLARLRPPAGFAGAMHGYLLGTDQLGRDILSRCLYGLRLTLGFALSGTLASLAMGVSAGLAAGLLGGRAEAAIMSIVDVMLSLPIVLVALFIVALAGTNSTVLILVLALAYWAGFARLVRAQVGTLRTLSFVEAAVACGASRARIAIRHILPNIASPVLVMATLNVSNLILLESSLSFLGLGVQPPTATLGSMVGLGRDYMPSAPWIVAAPACFIVLVSLVVMLSGDRLRDRLDVRLSLK